MTLLSQKTSDKKHVVPANNPTFLCVSVGCQVLLYPEYFIKWSTLALHTALLQLAKSERPIVSRANNDKIMQICPPDNCWWMLKSSRSSLFKSPSFAVRILWVSLSIMYAFHSRCKWTKERRELEEKLFLPFTTSEAVLHCVWSNLPSFSHIILIICHLLVEWRTENRN